MENQTSGEITNLIEQFVSFINQKPHNPSDNYRESVVKKALLDIGPIILPYVAKRIRKDFPILETAKIEHGEYDATMFRIWVYLISDIQNKYKLSKLPYDYNTMIPLMDIGRWVEYCELPHME